MTLESILETVALVTATDKEKIKSSKRFAQLVTARQIFCKIARIMTRHSFQEIGETINRDHSSVIHSIKKCDIFMQNEENFARKYHEALEEYQAGDEIFFTYIDDF